MPSPGVRGRLPRAAFGLAVAWAAGCSRGPSLPREMTFEGVRLEKATSWSGEGVSGVVFVPPGESLPWAALQVGVLASRKHASGAALHRWVMDQYMRSPTAGWHVASTADEACKIGTSQEGRHFLALHVCRGAGGLAACAEVDRGLEPNDIGRCASGPPGCWDEMCALAWMPSRTLLEPIVEDVLRR